MNSVKRVTSRFGLWIGIGALFLLRQPAWGETAVWRVESPAVQKQVSVAFGPGAAGNKLVILSLLGPQRELLPGGRFLLWVGYRDGTPLANKPVTVRTASPGNLLVGEGESTSNELTVHTNALGLAEIYLTPQPESGGDGGEEPPPT
ncbi:MAG: hypothetical protein PHE83_00675 [Opitutaceae bacterium]|nr:hypothetical protein [Opitutaceae bacterium]